MKDVRGGLRRARPWLGLALGSLLLGALFHHLDRQAAWNTLAVAGPLAVLTLVAWHLAVLAFDVRAWQYLVIAGRVSYAELYVMRWIAESVNNLAPVAQVGGEVVRATLLRGRLGSLAPAVLSVSADFLATAAALAPVAWLGVLLLDLRYGLMVSAAIVLLGLGSLLVLRVWPVLWRWTESRLVRLRAPLEGLVWKQFVNAWAWHLLAWLCGSGEIYLGLWLLGHPVTLVEALTIECVLQTARAIVFVVPAGIGVQEGAIVALTAWAGVPPATGLGLALLKRARELSLGLCGLLAWGAWTWVYRTSRPSTS